MEIWGKPMSRGSVVTPCSPTSVANGLPRFWLIWPPPTDIQPTRSSFSSEFPRTRVWLATALRVVVVSERPKPGTSDSCSALVPNGCVSSASKVLKRTSS